MKINFISLLIFSIFFSSCGGREGTRDSGGSGGSGGNSVSGIDFSGTYKQYDVECFDSSLTTLTNQTTFSLPTTDTMVISGNSFTETLISGSCSVTLSGNIVITSSNATGLNTSNVVVTSATGGSCTINTTINSALITPSISNIKYKTNDSVSSITNGAYIWDSSNNLFGLNSSYSDGAGGYCFTVFQKQ